MIWRIAGGALLAFVTAVYVFNASWLAPKPQGAARFMAHRGVHHLYDRTGLGKFDCTATRIFPPAHEFIENTIPSMRAAFEAGADMVEIDIHPTTDGEIAVFHDWTLDCRTEGAGVTRTHPMTYLKTLDVGYGYTADGGKSFPLRGKGVGLMPTLAEVLMAFPDKRFLINFMSGPGDDDAELLAAYLKRLPQANPDRLMVYGNHAQVNRLRELMPMVRGFSTRQAKRCLRGYVMWGWAGHMPKACHNTWIGLPVNYRHLIWGWPNRLQARAAAVDSEIVITGPIHETKALGGLNTHAALAKVPATFTGWIWTDKIEEINPGRRNPEHVAGSRR
ncbi:MAG: glycerophosphodiester phosphodiesterase family protein [Alphaproteobacteria bacterium]